MPVAQPENIPTICNLIKSKKPKSILDVGCGFGMYGFLARIYTGLWTTNITPKEYSDWKNLSRVDAIEIFEPWITDLQKMIYNKIFIGDMREIMPKVDNYDMIILGDSLEHLNKEDGENILKIAKEKAKTVVISMPDYFEKGEKKGGNEWELHQYVWKNEDFIGNPIIINNPKKLRVIVYEC